MRTGKPFSFRERWRSIQYAFEGIRNFFRQEHNARIHLVATIIVVIMAIFFSVTKSEALLLVLVTGLVWVAEMFNTAIEHAMDMISTQNDTRIKFIKDVAAAAVLVTALIALVTGLVIFIPKI